MPYREKRKSTRANIYNIRKATLYDEQGCFSHTREDVCDCGEEDCHGCHFPCPKCRSNKCGHECRVNRKWMYDKIEIEGNNNNVKENK